MPVLTRQACVQIVLDSWRFLQEKQRMTLYGYVILENHLHFIAKAKDLVKEVGDFKSFTARMIIDWLQKRNEMALLDQLAHEKAAHKTDREFQLGRKVATRSRSLEMR